MIKLIGRGIKAIFLLPLAYQVVTVNVLLGLPLFWLLVNVARAHYSEKYGAISIGSPVYLCAAIACIAPLIIAKIESKERSEKFNTITAIVVMTVPSFLSIAAVALGFISIGDYNVMEEDANHNIVMMVVFYCYLAVLIINIPAIILMSVRYATETAWFRQYFMSGRGGNARWAGGLNFEKYKNTGKGGIFLGSTLMQDTIFPSLISTRKDDDSHHITIAASGGGKSVTGIWPTLDQYYYPMVVIDPKGEHANYVSLHYAAVFDPYQRTNKKSENYNPLTEIDINSRGARALLQAISSACVIDEGGRDRHFLESAKTIIEGLIAHVLSTFPESERTLPHVADLLRGYDPELNIADTALFDSVVADMTTNDACGGLPMDAANLLLRAGDRERGSMLTTCFRALKWVNDPHMRKHLMSSSRRGHLQNFSNEYDRPVLFIVLPLDLLNKDNQTRWMRMLVALLNVHLFQRPRKPKAGKVLLILDEFPKLGYIPEIAEGIVTARGAGLKYWVLIQDIGQLKDDYKERWETFIGASNVQCYANQDQQTLEWISRALGGLRKDESDKYPLMRPDEVRNFLGKESPTQIVIPTTGLPMRLKRRAFKTIKQFKGL